MNSKPSPDELIQAVGATSEMSWIFYSTAVKQGFTPVQALQLTQTYLTGILRGPAIPPPEK